MIRNAELIAEIRQYALDHYENGEGWDYVVECFDDATISEMVGRARTLAGAIRKLHPQINLDV